MAVRNMTYLSPEEANVLNNLMPGNQNIGLGDKMKYLLDSIGSIGNTFYLNPANGNDANDGKSPSTAVATWAKAYSLLVANNNDVLFYIADTAGINLPAAFTWDKDYTHVIGLCSPVGIGGRARIFQLSTATGITNLITVSASGCIFKNLYIFHGVNDATSLVAVKVTGQRNYFENVHFAGIGNATMDVANAASLEINGGAENVFQNCFIGLDTIGRGANSVELIFKASATRNRFINCMIYAYITNAGHALVKVNDGTSIDRFQLFENCLFLTDSTNQAVTATSVFSLPAGIVQGKIILKHSTMITDGASGSGDWDSNNRGIIWNDSVAPAAAAVGGVMTKQ